MFSQLFKRKSQTSAVNDSRTPAPPPCIPHPSRPPVEVAALSQAAMGIFRALSINRGAGTARVWRLPLGCEKSEPPTAASHPPLWDARCETGEPGVPELEIVIKLSPGVRKVLGAVPGGSESVITEPLVMAGPVASAAHRSLAAQLRSRNRKGAQPLPRGAGAPFCSTASP